jgi:hypothetical protein
MRSDESGVATDVPHRQNPREAISSRTKGKIFNENKASNSALNRSISILANKIFVANIVFAGSIHLAVELVKPMRGH